MGRTLDARLDRIEAYYDCVPRAVSTSEEVGPFTLFVADEGTGWQFYARPRLGGTPQLTAEDVCRVLERQQALGVPRAIEWVEEVTPSLLPAVRAAGYELRCYPRLALSADVPVSADPCERAVQPAEPHLSLALG